MLSSPAVWIHGLISAFITGFVGAMGGVVIAPETFNLQEGFHKLWQLGLWSGVAGAFTYLKSSPLPAIKQAIEDKKALLGALLAAASLPFAVGCASLGGNGGTTLGDITPAIKIAAFGGTSYAVADNPELRPGFERAAAELRALVAAEKIDFATIMAIVSRLDVKELKSPEARIAILTGTLLLSQYGGRVVELDKLENVRPIAVALLEGIELGLLQ